MHAGALREPRRTGGARRRGRRGVAVSRLKRTDLAGDDHVVARRVYVAEVAGDRDQRVVERRQAVDPETLTTDEQASLPSHRPPRDGHLGRQLRSHLLPGAAGSGYERAL